MSEHLVRVDAPLCSIGAPLPSVVADEHTLVVAYFVDDTDPDWDGSTIRMVDPDVDSPVAVLRARPCTIFTLGYPNVDVLRGHRLGAIGLEPYGAFEVKNSAWIAALEHANRIHPHHDAGHFERLRHFVFTFHDSTLEFLSPDFEVEVIPGSLRQVMLDAVASL